MKKLLLGAVTALTLATTAHADFNVVVPQKPTGGTGTWANLVATEINKFLPADDQIVLEFVTGESDRKALKDYVTLNKADDHVLQITHGGNAESFLQVDLKGFDYRNLDPIFIQNLNIIVTKWKSFDPTKDTPIMASGSGTVSEAMAVTLLTCGTEMSVDEYLACFKDKVVWIPGYGGSDRRIAFMNGELNASRDNPIKTKKKYKEMMEDGTGEYWFSHGILNASTGAHEDDPNFPGTLLEDKFMQRHDVLPYGDFYDAYKLLKSWRDGLQKAIWIPRDHPRKQVIIDAIAKMLNDKDSMKIINKKVGKYPTLTGAEAQAHVDMLFSLINEDTLRNLLKVTQFTIGTEGVFKPELLQ